MAEEKNFEFKKFNKEETKTAVALRYDENQDEAPRVIAAGKGKIAEKIIEKAKESDVPLHKDAKLAKSLSNLEIGDNIPPELYEVVAEVLVFINRMDTLRSR
ncbi:MAG: EscU/YscU/HrcU family type III secretion system export apparatus switch protein [Lachnospiraceae bacterium]|nr:EscU/YscU/HrcU family type III secretion system export apparatus switch protein [Lachnospiraceae bacterium]